MGSPACRETRRGSRPRVMNVKALRNQRGATSKRKERKSKQAGCNHPEVVKLKERKRVGEEAKEERRKKTEIVTVSQRTWPRAEDTPYPWDRYIKLGWAHDIFVGHRAVEGTQQMPSSDVMSSA